MRAYLIVGYMLLCVSIGIYGAGQLIWRLQSAQPAQGAVEFICRPGDSVGPSKETLDGRPQ